MSGISYFPHVNLGDHVSKRVSVRSGLIEFALRYDKAKVDAELAAISGIKGASYKAIKRALDRSVSGLRTDVASYIRTVAPLRAKDVRAGLTVNKAVNRGIAWEASLRVRGNGIPLIQYDVRPRRQTSMKGRLPAKYRHLTYLLERGGKRHPNTSEDGEHTLFAAPVRGRLGVFYRIGDERRKLAQVWGPTLQFHVAPEPVRMEILRKGDLRFRKELAHQIKFLSEGGK